MSRLFNRAEKISDAELISVRKTGPRKTYMNLYMTKSIISLLKISAPFLIRNVALNHNNGGSRILGNSDHL
jgi:hypothetical protein